jgi:helix-turn-helix protein
MENKSNSSSNVVLINSNLNKTKIILQDLLSFSLAEIKNNPSSEEEILALWTNSIKNLGDFFFQEFEKTNNKKLYKRMIRSLMFKH